MATCPLRIDMLSDSTGDRCPSEASAHWRSTLGSSETIRSANRSALTSSNSEWFRWKCPPADVRRIPQGAPVFGESGSHWGVIEASAVTLPSIGMEPGDWSWYRRDWISVLPSSPVCERYALKYVLKSSSLLSRSAVLQNNVRSKYSRRIVPISRSTKGWDRGT